MGPQIADIERVVREVLADLGLLPQPECACPADAGSPAAEAPEQPASAGAATVQPESAQSAPPRRDAGDVIVADRVVTLAGIGDRLSAARRLSFARAIVTPAVRDELRRRNVALVVEDAAPAATGGGGRVALTVLGSRIDAAPLVDELGRLGMTVDLARFDCLVRATDDMAARLAHAGTAGVLLSNYGAIALCLANRHQGVRAVQVSDETRTAADAASVGANLLVVEPSRMSSEAMCRIVAGFCRQGPGECPEELRERLGC